MVKIWFPKNDLHVELFRRRNTFQARLVVLNVLVRGNPELRAQILRRIRPKHLKSDFAQFLFGAMVEMIRKEGKVDIEQVRCNIPLWVDRDGSPKFVAECLANYALLLSYRPTEAQVERAIHLLTTPPPPRQTYETKSPLPIQGKKPKRVPKRK